MAPQPLISIIIPTYNHAHLISRAIGSLIEQTYPHWEAIIINNFSEDNTVEVIESFQDPRIILINFRNNGSIAASRNLGVRQAKGEIIAFLDSDDYWYPPKLELSLNELIRSNADFCVNSEMIFINDREIKPIFSGSPHELNYSHLLFVGNIISTSSVVVKKSVLENVGLFNEDKKYVTAEDYDLWLRIAQKNYKMTSVKDIMGGHLEHTNNNSSAVDRHHLAIVEVLNLHFKDLPNSFWISVKKHQRWANLYYGSGRNATKQKQFIKACRFFLSGLKHNPFKIKFYPALGVALFGTIKEKV
jgi:glycosyltransferase involved in cell wall biosynthesis